MGEAAREQLTVLELSKTVKGYIALEPAMGAGLALAALREKRRNEFFEPMDIGAEKIKRLSNRTGAAQRAIEAAESFPVDTKGRFRRWSCGLDIHLVVDGTENGGYGVPDDLAMELATALRQAARRTIRYAERLEATLTPEKKAARQAENEQAAKELAQEAAAHEAAPREMQAAFKSSFEKYMATDPATAALAAKKEKLGRKS